MLFSFQLVLQLLHHEMWLRLQFVVKLHIRAWPSTYIFFGYWVDDAMPSNERVYTQLFALAHYMNIRKDGSD